MRVSCALSDRVTHRREVTLLDSFSPHLLSTVIVFEFYDCEGVYGTYSLSLVDMRINKSNLVDLQYYRDLLPAVVGHLL